MNQTLETNIARSLKILRALKTEERRARSIEDIKRNAKTSVSAQIILAVISEDLITAIDLCNANGIEMLVLNSFCVYVVDHNLWIDPLKGAA